jgi:alkylation response protein AidB-like acyl-CoA dehydrogenase
MGIDVETEYGGSGLSFFASVLAVEEIAKVEPSLSIFLHVHNSLVNTAIRDFGTEEQKQKYLPLLSQSVVSFDNNYEYR